MDKVAAVADDHYSNDLRGGEGHMEVGKLILNVAQNKCHMTLSVKPFGCMPSSGVSDGVQSFITTKYPGTIFCAVETSGDGATNFYSRVQMYLYKARIAAEQELQQAYADCGVTEEQVRAFLRDNPEYASPLHHSPHVAAGSAANLVHEVAPLITQSRAQRLVSQAKDAVGWVADTAKKAPVMAAQAQAALADPELRDAVAVDAGIVLDLLRGKAADMYGPLVKRLMGRAYYGDDGQTQTAPASVEPLAAE